MTTNKERSDQEDKIKVKRERKRNTCEESSEAKTTSHRDEEAAGAYITHIGMRRGSEAIGNRRQ